MQISPLVYFSSSYWRRCVAVKNNNDGYENLTDEDEHNVKHTYIDFFQLVSMESQQIEHY